MTPSNHNGKFRRKRRGKNVLARVLYCIVAVLTSLAAGLGVYAYQTSSASNSFQQLAQQVEQAKLTDSAANSATTPTGPINRPVKVVNVSPEWAAEGETQVVVQEIMDQYVELYDSNNDLYGWLTIEDTKINYPVMQSPYDPQKYLHADFSGNYSYPGTPFLDAQCSDDSDNLLIYAHNMRDGSMFGRLTKYENKIYWENHPVIQFNTLYEEGVYEVMAAFYDRVYLKTETDVFKFYQFIDAESEEDFDYAVAQFKEKSLYDTGVEAHYGDQLITLVTCAYHTDNGRFVVVARKAAQ